LLLRWRWTAAAALLVFCGGGGEGLGARQQDGERVRFNQLCLGGSAMWDHVADRNLYKYRYTPQIDAVRLKKIDLLLRTKLLVTDLMNLD
jgi:hypothetical protein